MLTQKKMAFFAYALLFSFFISCGKSANPTTSIIDDVETTTDGNTVTDTGTTTDDAIGANSESHEAADDYVLSDTDQTQIIFNGTTIATNAPGVTVNGNIVVIASAGTYNISGTLADGQIVIDTEDAETVKLILNGVDITHSTNAPIFVKNAEKAVIFLADGTTNRVTDGSFYSFENAEDTEPNAAIFSKSDLTLSGLGSLVVTGNYNDGIASKDGLIITSGNITVTAIDDGLRGKDYLIVKDGTLKVNADGDGLKSDNDEDETKGYISIEQGTIEIVAGGDAIEAQTDVMVSGGDISILSGGGSSRQVGAIASAKGIKGNVGVIIEAGTLIIDSADDALHSNNSLAIHGGNITIASGDDGIHAEETLVINNGEILITKSYEGIESKIITINDGIIRLTSDDDGLNVAGGRDGSGFGGRGDFSSSGNYFIYINGGYIAIQSTGDGIDANGSIEMTGGTVIVHGPTANFNGALDYDGTFKITGGFLLAAGSAGMAQAPGTSSTQPSILLVFRSAIQAGNMVHVQTDSGTGLLSFVPSKSYQSLVFSSPQLSNGAKYDVYVGGTASGTTLDGLYQNETYTPGTQYTNFQISGSVTRIQ